LTLVVHSSVACKWLLYEPLSEIADLLFSSGHALIAPDLILPETCNVAWHRLRQGELEADQAASMVAELPDMLDSLIPSVLLARSAFAIAREVGDPAYHCFYVALAERSDAQVVTADRRFIAGIAGSRWGHLIRALGAA
jgi:predicted nucleic acid-binding protein